MAHLDYVELPVAAVQPTVAFYRQAFGWAFVDYGPDYAAHEGEGCQLGLNAGDDTRPAAILPLIRVADIAAAHAAVTKAGGRVTQEIFDYPGGKRFHFADPSGSELGVYEPG